MCVRVRTAAAQQSMLCQPLCKHVVCIKTWCVVKKRHQKQKLDRAVRTHLFYNMFRVCVDFCMDSANEHYLFTAVPISLHNKAGLIDVTPKTRIKIIPYNEFSEDVCESKMKVVPKPIYKHVSIFTLSSESMCSLLTYGELSGPIQVLPVGKENRYSCVCGTVNCFSLWNVYITDKIEPGWKTTYYNWASFLHSVSSTMLRLGAYSECEIISKPLSLTRLQKIKHATEIHFKRLVRTFSYMHKNVLNIPPIIAGYKMPEMCDSWKELIEVCCLQQSNACEDDDDKQDDSRQRT